MKKIFSLLTNKFILAIFSFIIGYSIANLIFYANNQANASNSTIKNIIALVNKKFSAIGQQKIFQYNGFEFVEEIGKNVNQAVNKTSDNLVYTKDQLKKITNISDSKSSPSQDPSKITNDQIIKSSDVNFFEDSEGFYYQLILNNYRFEEVIISINSNSLKFSNYIGNNSAINGKNIASDQDKNRDKFSYSFNLPKYNINKDPEIKYLNNIITVKFYK